MDRIRFIKICLARRNILTVYLYYSRFEEVKNAGPNGNGVRGNKHFPEGQERGKILRSTSR